MDWVDTEWEEVANANEPELLFKCQMPNGGTCFKQYKPSIARFVQKRTRLKMEVVETFIGKAEQKRKQNHGHS